MEVERNKRQKRSEGIVVAGKHMKRKCDNIFSPHNEAHILLAFLKTSSEAAR